MITAKSKISFACARRSRARDRQRNSVAFLRVESSGLRCRREWPASARSRPPLVRSSKIGNDARVERARPHQNQIGFANRAQHFRKRTNAPRHQPDASDAACADLEIFVSPATIVPSSSSASSVTFCSVEGKIRPRIASTCDETRIASGKSPVTFVSAVRKRLPKLWPPSPRPPGTDIEKVRQQVLVFRKRHHAIADIARRKDAIFPAETAGTAAVVRDRHNRRKIGDGPCVSFPVAAPRRIPSVRAARSKVLCRRQAQQRAQGRSNLRIILH